VPSPLPSPAFPCNLVPEERATQIRELLSIISDPSLFDEISSPQAKALEWITKDDAIEPMLCPNDKTAGGGCTRGGNVNPLVQRYVLAAFYFATEGDSWDQCSANDGDNCDRVVTPFGVSNQRVGDKGTENWLGPTNECEWGGMACWGGDTPDLNLCIDQLDFDGDGLSGELIPELSSLDSLRFLILEQGNISGPIPSQYGDLDRLMVLDIDFNQISGQMPEEIYNLSNLWQLDLNDNDITGSISNRIGELRRLAFFQIDHNMLSGTIPSEMGELENLRYAYMDHNELRGQMPDGVCALRNSASPPGVLGVFVTDCAGTDPEVSCPCCSSCEPSIFLTGSPVTAEATTAKPSSETPTSSPTTMEPTCSAVSFTINVLTDRWPSETSWTLVNTCSNQTQTSVAPNTLYYSANTSHSNEYCIPAGAYTFTINDTYNDGLCCSHGPGSYAVAYDGEQVASGGQFAGAESTSFGLCGPAAFTGPSTAEEPTTVVPSPPPSPAFP